MDVRFPLDVFFSICRWVAPVEQRTSLGLTPFFDTKQILPMVFGGICWFQTLFDVMLSCLG